MISPGVSMLYAGFGALLVGAMAMEVRAETNIWASRRGGIG